MSTALDTMISNLEGSRPDAVALLNSRAPVFLDENLAARASTKAAEWTGSREKQGVYLYLIGRHERAMRVLEQEAKSDVAKFFLGITALELNQPVKAVAALEGLKNDEARVAYATALLRAGDVDAAKKAISALEKSMSDNVDVQVLAIEYLFRHDSLQDAYSRINDLLGKHATHTGALFLGGLIAQRCGQDDLALERFESLSQQHPAPVASLMNLGILYEDRGDDKQAIRCYRAVLKSYPDHERAKLYAKDAEASLTMYYDEDRERKEDKRLQVLRTPVSDFELSVRSRNCLQKMNIQTLGDLIVKTESELLSYKNFGETSLQEIKAILGSRGLRLGMKREEALQSAAIDEAIEKDQPKHEGVLAESIDALDLSVRARKCMERMTVTTIGELAEHTEQQLMATPNFGATSLIEVKRKLAELGLSLKS